MVNLHVLPLAAGLQIRIAPRSRPAMSVDTANLSLALCHRTVSQRIAIATLLLFGSAKLSVLQNIVLHCVQNFTKPCLSLNNLFCKRTNSSRTDGHGSDGP